MGSHRIRRLTVPCLEVSQVHSPMTPLLFRVPSSSLPPSSFDEEHTYQGSRPSSRHDQAVSTPRGNCQSPAMFRPQVFSTSRRLSPPPGATGLFHPATTSRVHPVQGLLPPCSHPPFPEELPPCRCSAACSPPVDDVHTRRPSTTRPFSARRSVAFGSVISLPVARSPRRVLSSPRFSYSPYAPVPRCDPLMKLLFRSSVARWPRQPSTASFQ
jgi:hypothetical protein